MLSVVERLSWRAERRMHPYAHFGKPSRGLEPPRHAGNLTSGPLPEHLLAKERAAALRAVRSMRGQRDDFPNDFGCEVQIYLALAMEGALPQASGKTIALALGIQTQDIHFFWQLVEIARTAESQWVRQDIIDAAIAAIRRAA